jgi:hypothetical protein
MSRGLWLTLIVCSGCSLRFTRPPEGVLANGEPLSVQEITTARTTTERREVGTVQYQSSSG